MKVKPGKYRTRTKNPSSAVINSCNQPVKKPSNHVGEQETQAGTTTYAVYIISEPIKPPMEGMLANVAVKTTTLNEDTSDYHTLPDKDSEDQPKQEPVEDGPCDVHPHPSVTKTKSSKTAFVPSIDINKCVSHLHMLTNTVLVPRGPYITLPSPYKVFLDPDPGGTSHPSPEPGDVPNEVQYDTPESIAQMVQPMQAST